MSNHISKRTRRFLRRLIYRAKRAGWQVRRLIVPKYRPLVSALTLSDADFLALFDIAAVEERLQSGKIEGAKQELLDYYSHRGEPEWPAFPVHMIGSHQNDGIGRDPEEIMAQAEAILQGRIPLGSFGEMLVDDPIDWTHNPTDEPEGLLTRHLNRHYWLRIPLEAFQISGDNRYAAYLDQTIRSWIADAQRPKERDENSVTWALMEAGIRSLLWPTVFAKLQSSAAFSPETRLAMLKSMFDHAEFLTRYQTRSNHVLREAAGLAHLALYFPEFRASDAWWETASNRLSTALTLQVNDDGSHFELSTGYQILALEEFHHALKLFRMRSGNEQLADETTSTLIKMYRTLAYITRPDGSLPQLNDSLLKEPGYWPNMLAAAASEFEQPDLLFIATRTEGERPSVDSTSIPDAGWYVMRDGWKRDSRYLLFESGPYGGHHGHEDKLSFEVFSHRTAFLVDPGTYTYNTDDPFRDYFMSTRAHNTMVVAGRSQIRRWLPGNRRARAIPGPHGTWASNDVFDYSASEYTDGYGEFEFFPPKDPEIIGGISHRRQVLFLKPDYWVVVDEINSERPLPFEFLLHAGPALELVGHPRGTVSLQSARTGAVLAIVPEDTEFVGPAILQGAQHPIQGWVSSGRRFHKEPAFAITYQWPPCTSLSHATLLYPDTTDGAIDELVITRIPVGDGSGIAWEIMTPRGKDIVSLAPNAAPRIVAGRATDAQVVVARFDSIGRAQGSAQWPPGI